MYAICVEFTCREARREAFVARVEQEGILSAVLAEEGCLRYEYFFSSQDPNRLLLMEEWESKAHQQQHLNLPHMVALRSFKEEYISHTVLKELV